MIQSVNGPTQECGHTLERLLFYGLPVLNLEIGDALFSDHMPVLFNFVPFGQSAKPCTPAHHYHAINHSITAQFSAAFYYERASLPSVSSNSEELALLFHSTCQIVLVLGARLQASFESLCHYWKAVKAAR